MVKSTLGVQLVSGVQYGKEKEIEKKERYLINISIHINSIASDEW